MFISSGCRQAWVRLWASRSKAAFVLMVLYGVTGSSPGWAGNDPGPLSNPALDSQVLTTNTLMAAAYAGDRLLVVGAYGRIAYSDDQGHSWVQARVPVSSDLVAVQFVSPSLGWAVGHDGVILHTADGGQNWSKQLDGVQVTALIQQYYGHHLALEPADQPLLDAEVQRFISDGADKPFLDVHFTDARNGFAVGAFNMAFRTRDGGEHWEPLLERTANPQGFHLYGLGVSNGDLFMAGEAGLLRRWDPARERFVVLDSPYAGSFFGIQGSTAGVLAFGMRGNAFLSSDRGVTWQRVKTPTTAALNSAAHSADNRLVVVSQEGELLVLDHLQLVAQPGQSTMPLYGVAMVGKSVLLVGRRGVRLASIQ